MHDRKLHQADDKLQPIPRRLRKGVHAAAEVPVKKTGPPQPEERDRERCPCCGRSLS